MKKTILFLLFLLVITSVNAIDIPNFNEAQQCEQASDEGVDEKAQKMWNRYSQLYEGETNAFILEKTTESLENWVPEEGSNPNWVDYEKKLIKELTKIANGELTIVQHNTYTLELPKNFQLSSEMQELIFTSLDILTSKFPGLLNKVVITDITIPGAGAGSKEKIIEVHKGSFDEEAPSIFIERVLYHEFGHLIKSSFSNEKKDEILQAFLAIDLISPTEDSYRLLNYLDDVRYPEGVPTMTGTSPYNQDELFANSFAIKSLYFDEFKTRFYNNLPLNEKELLDNFLKFVPTISAQEIEITKGNTFLCNPGNDIDEELIRTGVIDEDGSIPRKSSFERSIEENLGVQLSIIGNNCKYKDCELSCGNLKTLIPSLKEKDVTIVLSPENQDRSLIQAINLQPENSYGGIQVTSLSSDNTISYEDNKLTIVNTNSYDKESLLILNYVIKIEFEDGYVSDQELFVDISKEGEDISIFLSPVGSLPALDKKEVDDRLFTIKNDMKIYYIGDETQEAIDITPSNEEFSDIFVEDYEEYFSHLVISTDVEPDQAILDGDKTPIIYYYSKVLVLGGTAGGESETAILIPQDRFDELFSSINLDDQREIREVANNIMESEPVKIVTSGDLLRAAKWIEPISLRIIKGKTREAMINVYNLDKTPEWSEIDEMISVANTPLRIEIERDETNTLSLYDDENNLIQSIVLSQETMDKLLARIKGDKYQLELRDRLMKQFLS